MIKKIVFVSLLFPLVAHAHYPYTVQECTQLSTMAYYASKAKEHGASKGDVLEAAKSSVKKLVSMDSFIRDKNDITAFLGTIEVVFEMPGTPDEDRDASFGACMSELVAHGSAL